MNKFHKKVLENINISVERISFRKDKWQKLFFQEHKKFK